MLVCGFCVGPGVILGGLGESVRHPIPEESDVKLVASQF